MSVKAPTYLYKNRHGVFYFRVVIPKKFQQYFSYKREIKRSLGTENKHLALKKARAYMVDFDKILSDIQSGKRRTTQLITAKDLQLANGTKLGEITIDLGNPQLEQEALMKLISSTDSPSEIIKPKEPSYTLGYVCKKYCDDQVKRTNWSEKTYNENIAIFKLLFRMLGEETQISSITRIHLSDVKDKVRKLPSNMKKHKRYNNKTIDQIIAMDDISPISVTTCDKYIRRISGLFNWAKIEGYIPSSIAEKLSDGPDDKKNREPFSQNDLITLFQHANFSKFPKASQYWVPLICLYSGARQNEICQLYLDDIQIIDGIYVFCIRDEKETQHLKNKASKRNFPIHPVIFQLGFLEYIKFLEANKMERLFPELKYISNYSDTTSKWFTKYLRKLQIYKKNVKVFHSFRNTFINHLKQKKADLPYVAAIVGHASNSITYEGYANEYEPPVLKPYIDMVDYGLEHTSFVIDEGKIKKSWK